MGTQLPRKKGYSPHPIFGPCLLWPNGLMDQFATWYGGKPRPRRLCLRWGRSSPKKGYSPQFSVHVYCGQTAGWMKTPVGTDIDLGPGHIVRRGPSSRRKVHSSPLFSADVYRGHGRPSQVLLSSCTRLKNLHSIHVFESHPRSSELPLFDLIGPRPIYY